VISVTYSATAQCNEHAQLGQEIPRLFNFLLAKPSIENKLLAIPNVTSAIMIQSNAHNSVQRYSVSDDSIIETGDSIRCRLIESNRK
jgi:hypothetical protein